MHDAYYTLYIFIYTCNAASAQAFKAENSEGDTIMYNILSDTEVEVTDGVEYSGNIIIPLSPSISFNCQFSIVN